MVDLFGAMAGSVVEHYYRVMVRMLFTKVLQERLKTATVHPR